MHQIKRRVARDPVCRIMVSHSQERQVDVPIQCSKHIHVLLQGSFQRSDDPLDRSVALRSVSSDRMLHCSHQLVEALRHLLRVNQAPIRRDRRRTAVPRYDVEQ